jgi:RNA polymerase sigma-70 factor (ECF subfamily)
VVAALIRMTGDWDLAEESAQDAFAQALQRWPRDGGPGRPGAWLMTVARNRALDRLRRRRTEAAGVHRLSAEPVPEAGVEVDAAPAGGDDRLSLIFTCCHPALPLEARVALTLRGVAGLETPEIARAFMVSEATMAQRLVRAKRKIRNAAIPYRVPPAHLLAERTAGVLAVLYLLFNEGYAATGGEERVRQSLCAEAIRLARLVQRLMPEEPEAEGLLALMILHHARAAGRVDARGELVLLEEQDRSLWDQGQIADGLRRLDEALARRRPGPYQIQAAIAACHASAPTAADTDWPQIAGLYGHLAELTGSPVVELNRAVAVGMAEGPDAGLRLVDELDESGALAGYHLLPATRAELLRRLGRPEEAALAYARALESATAEAERRHLARRLAESRLAARGGTESTSS